jgi:Ran GTPase-activating protein (RanGAP) involved in mRNA processing and transport
VDLQQLLNPDKNANDFKMMGKHAESKYYKNIFAKMGEQNKDAAPGAEEDFEDIEDEDEEEI